MSSSMTVASQRTSSPSVGDGEGEERAACLFACGEVAHPGFGSRLGPQPEADAGGSLFPADQGLAEQALVLPETLGARVGGAGHVADDRCCGCGQVHDPAPWVTADACHLRRHNPKLWTIVQSQGAA